MLKAVVDVGVPVLVVFAMFVVGTGLTAADFRRVARRPRGVLAAVVGQVVVLPGLGWLLTASLGLQPAVAAGVLLVAACPAGAMANVYTRLARGDVALSVTLAAVSCLAAGLTMPAALAALPTGHLPTADFSVPPVVLGAHLLVLLILPVLGGMGFRRFSPAFAARHGRTLLRLSVAALLVLLGVVIAEEAGRFADAFAGIALAAGLLTVLAFGSGWATGWAGGCPADGRVAVGMVFAVRNVGIATAVAVTVLGRVEFAVFATAYFLAQVPILLAAAVVFRPTRAGDENTLAGAAQP